MQEIGKDRLEDPREFGPDTGAAPTEPWGTEEGEAASEDEQMDYDLLVIRARKMMFGKSKDKILTMLGSSESPAKGIGKVGSMLIKSLRESAKQSGREIADEVAINAAAEIGEDLSDLAKSAGVYQYDSDEDELQELQDAMLWGVKFYGDGMVQSGEITPEIQATAAKVTQENTEREVAEAPPATPEQQNDLKKAIRQGIAEGGTGGAGGGGGQTGDPGIINGAMPGGM